MNRAALAVTTGILGALIGALAISGLRSRDGRASHGGTAGVASPTHVTTTHADARENAVGAQPPTSEPQPSRVDTEALEAAQRLLEETGAAASQERSRRAELERELADAERRLTDASHDRQELEAEVSRLTTELAQLRAEFARVEAGISDVRALAVENAGAAAQLWTHLKRTFVPPSEAVIKVHVTDAPGNLEFDEAQIQAVLALAVRAMGLTVRSDWAECKSDNAIYVGATVNEMIDGSAVRSIYVLELNCSATSAVLAGHGGQWATIYENGTFGVAGVSSNYRRAVREFFEGSATTMRAEFAKIQDNWARVSGETFEPFAVAAALLTLNVDAAADTKTEPASVGTGFVIARAPYIVTAHHIVKDRQSVRVRFSSEAAPVTARVVASDPQTDLAILTTAATASALPERLPRVQKTHDLALGTKVFTLGFPLGQILGSSTKYTEGSISSKTGMDDDARVMQVSVPIHPGNSGGPLCTEDGAVVGVIVSIANPAFVVKASGALPQNIGYAVKSDYLLALCESQGLDVSSGDRGAVTLEQMQQLVVRVEAD